MDKELTAIRRRKTFIILAFVAVALAAIAIWIVLIFDRTPADEAEISNIDRIELKVHPTVKSIIQKRLREAIDLAYGIEDDREPVGVIRKESISIKDEKDGTKQYNFLVDVDEYELTYRAEVWEKKEKKNSEVFFYCVPPSQSKYPDNFCVGYNGQSTLSVTIGYSLPLTAKKTMNGYYYDAKIKYKEKSIWPYVDIFVSSCGSQKIKDEARNDFRDWIKEQGYDPNLFEIQVPDNCTGGE